MEEVSHNSRAVGRSSSLRTDLCLLFLVFFFGFLAFRRPWSGDRERPRLSPMGEGRAHPFLCHSPSVCLLIPQTGLSSFPPFSLGRDGKFFLPSPSTLPSGTGAPQGFLLVWVNFSSSQLLPDPRRRREDGELRPPRAAPPLSTDSSEEEGSEPDSEGFRRLRLGGRRDGGGSSSSSDSEP